MIALHSAPDGWEEVERGGGLTAWFKQYGPFRVFVTDASGSLAPTTLTETVDVAVYDVPPGPVGPLFVLRGHDFANALTVLRSIQDVRGRRWEWVQTPHEPFGWHRTYQEWECLIHLSIAQAKREIRDHIARGMVPATVANWQELAVITEKGNEGWNDWCVFAYGGTGEPDWTVWDDDDVPSPKSVAALARVHQALDAWLQRGRP